MTVPNWSRAVYSDTPTNNLLASLFVRLSETPGEWELIELLDRLAAGETIDPETRPTIVTLPA